MAAQGSASCRSVPEYALSESLRSLVSVAIIDISFNLDTQGWPKAIFSQQVSYFRVPKWPERGASWCARKMID